MQADTAPETRPRRATTASTLSYASVMQITDYPRVYFGPRHFCSTHDAHRISCCSNRSSPRGLPIGARQATLVQPRPDSSPGVRRYSRQVARRRSGGREVRDKGVTYFSGRSWTGCNVVRRDNEADRDVTVIAVIPVKASHQGRCRGAGHHRVGRRRRAPARDGVAPGCRHRSVTSSSCAWRVPSALSGRCRSSRVTSSSCALPFLSVAGVSRGVASVTSSSCALPLLPGRRGFPDVAAVTGSRCARACAFAGGLCAAVTRSSCASRTSFAEPPRRWAGRATRPLRRCG